MEREICEILRRNSGEIRLIGGIFIFILGNLEICVFLF